MDDPVPALFRPQDLEAMVNLEPEQSAYNDAKNGNRPPVPPSQRPEIMERGKEIIGPKGQIRIECEPHGYGGEDSRAVKYIRDLNMRRDRYQVEIGATILRRKMVFDTKEIKQHFKHKHNHTISAADLGWNKDHDYFQTPQEWIDEALIWVCAPDRETDKPAIYSHVCKLQRFHHSSLVAGSTVIGAGEWIVRQGKLWKISANSGHYRNRIDAFYRAVLHMSGAFNDDTTVFLYDSEDDVWVDYPIAKFINAPTGGDRYRTHPHA